MTEPIKAGDLCRVVDGAQGKDSPNLGLIVRVLSYIGDHTTFGRVWRCEAEFAEVVQPGWDAPPGTADFAQAWLRKIPGVTPQAQVVREAVV